MKNIKTEKQEEKLPSKASKNSFSELGISPTILAALKTLNLEIPTPIQHQAIPVALKGQDIIGMLKPEQEKL